MSAKPPPDLEFHSGVSAFTGEPFVMIQWGQMTGQLTPAEAEEHAVHVIRAAQAARHDAAILAEMRTVTADHAEGSRLAMAFTAAVRDRLEDIP